MDVTFRLVGAGEIEARLSEDLYDSERNEEVEETLRSSGLVPVSYADDERFVTKTLGGASSGEQAARAVIELQQSGFRVGADSPCSTC